MSDAHFMTFSLIGLTVFFYLLHELVSFWGRRK
ncbi:hypothetical protein E9W_07041 [Moraxella catarrhalis CO72]|nr:hypothetical protein E9W_07041 [Moraxella catarrhalis CO72]